MTGKTVISVGNYDGVHFGHQALMRSAADLAGKAGRVVVCAFEPHPHSRLQPNSIPERLSTFQQRASLLIQAGADEVVSLEPSDELLNLEPSDFMKWIIERYQPAAIVEGADFRFGRSRRGDVEVLRQVADSLGLEVLIVPPVETNLTDQSIVIVSSTLIRWLLRHGRVADAKRLLGRPYRIAGQVESGDRRGRIIGVPTVNINTELMLPADGVYAGRAMVSNDPNGLKHDYPAAVNIGVKPTFQCRKRICEAHLIGYDGPVDHYDWPIEVELIEYIREEIRFPDPSILGEQIRRDIERVKRYVKDVDGCPV